MTTNLQSMYTTYIYNTKVKLHLWRRTRSNKAPVTATVYRRMLTGDSPLGSFGIVLPIFLLLLKGCLLCLPDTAKGRRVGQSVLQVAEMKQSAEHGPQVCGNAHGRAPGPNTLSGMQPTRGQGAPPKRSFQDSTGVMQQALRHCLPFQFHQLPSQPYHL